MVLDLKKDVLWDSYSSYAAVVFVGGKEAVLVSFPTLLSLVFFAAGAEKESKVAQSSNCLSSDQYCYWSVGWILTWLKKADLNTRELGFVETVAFDTVVVTVAEEC